MTLDQQIETLAASTHFKEATAYNRTLMLCEVFTKNAVKVPNAHALREYTKGSSRDIQKAIDDYRKLLSDQLLDKEMPGIPGELVPLMAEMWKKAQEFASHQFDDQVASWGKSLQQQQEELALAKRKSDELEQKIQYQAKQIDSLQARLDTQKKYIEQLESGGPVPTKKPKARHRVSMVSVKARKS